MKKRLLSTLLTMCMAVGMLPTTAFASTSDPSQPELLGTVSDYQSTLNTMYDKNGLRVVNVGFKSSSGDLGVKYGIINRDGNWVAQPIYDKIKPIATDYRLNGGKGARTPATPFYFIGGYVQVVRDGKMGLMNTNGEEVIPCQYDLVQMPSEGMAAVYNKTGSGSTCYLGYWSLAQNREIVKPNKYIAAYTNTSIGGIDDKASAKPTGDLLQVHDFIDGYALVTTAKADGFTVSATIIDKAGKEVLPQAYPVALALLTGSYSTYPQKGAYLSFVKSVPDNNYKVVKYDDKSWQTVLTGTHYATGLATTSGIVIPAAYTRGVLASPGEAQIFINAAAFQIYPKENLVVTEMDYMKGILYGGAYTSLDLKGNTVVAPGNQFEGKGLNYDPDSKLLFKEGTLYNTAGKVLGSAGDMADGLYAHNGVIFTFGYGTYIQADGGYTPTTIYALSSKGAKLNLTQKMGWSTKVETGDNRIQLFSDCSIGGYFWVQNNQRKWGLLDISGKEILPFVYDAVDYGAWTGKQNAYAIVTQNGKQGLVSPYGKVLAQPSYDSLRVTSDRTAAIAGIGDKVGLVDIATGKVTLPIKYDGFQSFAGYYQLNPDYFAMGVCPVYDANYVYFVDRNGNEVYIREISKTQTHLNFTNEALYGLYNVYEGQIDSRGRLIIPAVSQKDWAADQIASTVVYQQGGNVYRVKANYVDATFGVKPYAPQSATATPSETKLLVNGSSTPVDAYAIAGNNYIKLRDLATMISGSEKSFEVSWDGSKNAINLLSGKPYTAVGGEMTKGDGQNRAASRTTAKIYLNGGEVSLTAYSIGGNNYFKLRDVMQIFNVDVGYDNATQTATITTADSYTLAQDALARKAAFEQAYTAATGNPYQQKQIYDEPVVKFVATPTKYEYNVGDAFDSAGFTVQYQDVYGNGTNISKDIVLDVNGTKIYDGYVFATAGKKTVNCSYKGEKLNTFVITVYEKVEQADLPLEDGDYYIMLMGKYVVPVADRQWMELSDKKPDKPFTVKHLEIDKETGHHIYHVMIGGKTVHYYGSGNGAQLIGDGGIDFPHKWRIAKYSDFWTMRDEKDQAMAVNASGASDKNGTKVTLWKYTGKAPEHAKIQFVSAK